MTAANDVGHEVTETVRAKVPVWYWILGVAGVLWSLMGAMDYIMTQTQNEAYFAKIPDPLKEYFFSLPTWLEFFWALAVWGGLLGWILMLARSRFAVTAFLVSLASLIVNFGYSLVDGGLALQAEHMGPAMGYGFTALIVVFAIFALWFSGRARRRGWLR